MNEEERCDYRSQSFWILARSCARQAPLTTHTILRNVLKFYLFTKGKVGMCCMTALPPKSTGRGKTNCSTMAI